MAKFHHKPHLGRTVAACTLSAAAALLPLACTDGDSARRAATYTSRSPEPVAISQFSTGAHSGGLFVDNGTTLDAFCSGTLIAPGVVLTAAHCVKFSGLMAMAMRDVPMFFQLGQVRADMSSDLVPVAQVVAHPGYVADTSFVDVEPDAEDLNDAAGKVFQKQAEAQCRVHRLEDYNAWFNSELSPQMLLDEVDVFDCLHTKLSDYLGHETYNQLFLRDTDDIAVVFLARDVYGSRPVILPQSSQASIDVAQMHTAAGYGRYATAFELPENAGTLHETKTQIAAQSAWELLLDNGGRTACSGDSGGGLLQTQGLNNVLEGVLVRAAVLPLSGRCLGKVAATKVAAYRPWIEATVAPWGIALP